MRDEITVTKKEMTEKLLIASSRSSVILSERTKKPQLAAVINLTNTVLIGEILKILFDEDDLLEIQDDV